MKNKNRVAKLGKIEELFKTLTVLMSLAFQEIIINTIKGKPNLSIEPCVANSFVESVWDRIILLIIPFVGSIWFRISLLLVLYIILHYLLLKILNSNWVTKLILREEYIDGVWVECIIDVTDARNIKYLGKTHINVNVNGISYSGDNYGLDYTHKGRFEATNTSYNVKDASIDLLYVNSTSWKTEAVEEGSHGILNFQIELEEKTKKPPTYHTGTFYKKLDNGDYCAMKFFAKKVQDKADLKKLLYNDHTSEPFKKTFKKYLKDIKLKYDVGESNE